MSSKINLQTCEYARKSSIFQDNQLIYNKSVYLDSMIDRTGQINKYLVENGVTVNQISIHAINLEEYFLRKVGA